MPAVRGAIHDIGADARGRYRYDYYDVSEPDSHYQAFAARGLQGGGDTWAGIVHGLVQIECPSIAAALFFDPEGEGLAIWSDDREALETVASLVARAKQEPALLDRALQRAQADGELE